MKKEIIILLALIAVLSGYLVLRKTDHTNYQLPELDAIAASEVDRLEIKEGETTLFLEKTDGEWVVDIEGFPGKKEEIEKQIQTASELALTALVSEAKSYSRYNLDGDNARTISIFKGEKILRQFNVGKAAPSGQHTFVTVEGDPSVYHARGSFASQFKSDAVHYINKTVLSLKPDEVSGVAISQNGITISGKKTEENWMDESGVPLDKAGVDNLIATLSALSCEKWLPAEAIDSKQLASVTVMTDRPVTLTLFESDDPEVHIASITEKNFSFELSQATWNNLTGSLETVMAESPKSE